MQTALLAAFYWPVLSGAAEFYHRDLPLYFEPLSRYLGDAAREGRFPLWNDRLYTGMPQVAVGHPNVFYPFTWIVALLPFSQGLSIYLGLHQLVLGVGMFLFVRRFRWGSLACWIAGVGGAWNGYITGLQSNYQLITAATWIPMLLWLLSGKSRCGFSSGNVVGAAVCTYLLIGSGAPELIAPGMASAVTWCALLAYKSFKSGVEWAGSLFWRGVAVGCGVILAAPMILPALEWLRLSPRGAGLLPVNVLAWSTEWYQWLGMLVSRPFGVDAVLAVPRYVDSPFVGPGVLVLAALGLWQTRWCRLCLWLGTFLLLCLITSAGTNEVGRWIVTHIPGSSVVRYPVKLVLLPLAIIVFAAAKGSRCVNSLRMTATAMWFSMVSLLVVAGGAIVSAHNIDYQWYWTTVTKNSLALPTQWSRTANTILGQKLLGTALGLLVLVLSLFARRRAWISGAACSRLVLGVVSIPIVTNAWVYDRNWLPLRIYSPEPSWVRLRSEVLALGAHPKWRILPMDYTTDAMAVSPQWLLHRYGDGDSLLRHERFWVGHAASSRGMLLTNTAIDANISSASGYEATPTKNYLNLLTTAAVRASIAPERLQSAGFAASDRALARICAITATKVILVKPDPRAKAARYFAPGPYFRILFDLPQFSPSAPGAPRVYEALTARPRAYVTRSISVLPNEAAIGQMLTTDKETRFDVERNHVYVGSENGGAVSEVFDDKRGSEIGDPSHLKLTQDTGERVRVSVSSATGGLLVLADQYYPGWTATVDGTPVEILPVNIVNRGVMLSAGKHEVEFTYRPRALQLGIILCLGAVVVLGGVVCYKH